MTLSSLAAAIGYEFGDTRLLQRALTHRSFSADNYERLEFLGDSVLNCVVAEALVERFPEQGEGDLSRQRARIVCGEALATVARGISLGHHLRLGDGERKNGGRERASILADALEAVIGAVHRDGGFDAARSVVLRLFGTMLGEVDASVEIKDAKTRLQEYLQGRRMDLPKYDLVATRGAAHDQSFDVVCRIDALSICAAGSGGSRRAAEQAAAAQALTAIGP